jgi:hypothetical protein
MSQKGGADDIFWCGNWVRLLGTAVFIGHKLYGPIGLYIGCG